YASELSGALCQFSTDKYLIYTPSKWNKAITAAITEATNIDENKIIIANTASRVQKTTNELFYDVIFATMTAIAASIYQKNIKIVLSRSEQNEYINNYIKSKISHTSEIEKDGSIKSMSINIEIENGAYSPFTKKILRHMVKNATGLYNNIKNVNITAKAYITNEAPKAFNTHSVSSDVYFALESHLYNIAEKLNISTAELKLKNIINNDIEKIINTVTKQSDFYRKDFCYKLSSIKRKEGKAKACLPFSIPLRGIGLSVVSGERFNYKAEEKEDSNNKNSMAAAVVELEADPCTYKQTLQKITLVLKAGKIENPINATTSLQRDVNQILDMLIDDTKLDLCPVNVSFIQADDAPSYIGNIIFNTIPSAYFQALRQILNSTINKMPVNVEGTFNMITSSEFTENTKITSIISEEDSKASELKKAEIQEKNDNDATKEKSDEAEQSL
ncbi:MAG: molybdopterin-dependent oxidoreductase, partial [Treponema sp.]|nr:molybdopterin-dependent oxidoreductase [Treponema sp.]